MNTALLLQFYSRSLQTNIHRYTKDGRLIETICEMTDFQDPCHPCLPLDKLMKTALKQSYPLLFSFDILHYALIDMAEEYCLIGPVRITPSIAFRTTYMADTAIDLTWYAGLHMTDLTKFVDHVFLLWNIQGETKGNRDDLLTENLALGELRDALQKRYTNLLFQNSEYEKHHNPYSQEQREQASIEQGDVDALKQAFSESYTGEVGTLSPNKLRNLRNLGIVLTTLASRSAIRGGLTPEIAYSLSDSYIQQLEELTDLIQLQQFVRNMEIHYTTLVKEAKELGEKDSRRSLLVEQCKNYIFSHRHDRITVNTLAADLGYHADYLSHAFKTEEGIGISAYIQKEKINRAKNLLIYTQYTYSEIANYLGFSSQSHFGQVFKKYTNETPHKFRNREKSDAFIE